MFSIHAYTHSAVFIAFRLAHTTASLSLGAPLTFLSLPLSSLCTTARLAVGDKGRLNEFK